MAGNANVFGKLCFLGLILVTVLLWTISNLLAIPGRDWAVGTRGGLGAEAWIEHSRSAAAVAHQAVEEALVIWNDDPRNWHTLWEQEDDDSILQARRVTQGPLASSGILLVRGQGQLVLEESTSWTAQTIFEALVTKNDGSILNAPTYLHNNTSTTVLASYDASSFDASGSLQVLTSQITLPLPFLSSFQRDRELVVLNAISPTNRLAIVKSVLHKKVPGQSRFSNAATVGKQAKGTQPAVVSANPRALHTFMISVEPHDSMKHVFTIRWITWTDLVLKSAGLTNWMLLWSYRDFVSRIQQTLLAQTPPKKSKNKEYAPDVRVVVE